MKRTTLTKHIDAFRTEGLMLLRFQLAFNRISKFEDIKEISRSDLVDRIIALKAVENDLLIRICKFDDDTKGVHSFPKAVREIGGPHINKVLIEKKVQQFSKVISKVKKERRHTQLAHLKIGVEDDDYDIRYDFTPAIKLIIEIIDLMNINKIGYAWSDGQYEKFDLRLEVLREQLPTERNAPTN